MNGINQEKIISQLISSIDPIESEVIRMMGNREIFQELIKISKNNPKISRGNSFWDFLKESYVALMVSAVCRQTDTDSRSASLINLLNTLLKPQVSKEITKDWYCQQYHRDDDIMPGLMEGIGKGDFEEHFGSGEYIDISIVQADLNELIEKTKKIKTYRNKRIAHRDSNNKLVFDVNFNDLDEAIETVRKIASRYYLLLKQGGNDLIPVDQTDWQEVFTVPWIKPNEHN